MIQEQFDHFRIPEVDCLGQCFPCIPCIAGSFQEIWQQNDGTALVGSNQCVELRNAEILGYGEDELVWEPRVGGGHGDYFSIWQAFFFLFPGIRDEYLAHPRDDVTYAVRSRVTAPHSAATPSHL